MLKNRLLPTAMIALAGAIIGSFSMMLYASTHFAGVAGTNQTPPAVAAAALTGVSDQDRIVTAVKRTKPSVVAINVEVNGKQFVPADPFMQQFFGQQGPGSVQPYRASASGSGFVYNSSGLIVTNAHVVTPPSGGQISKLTVEYSTGRKVSAHVVASNIGADIALIKVDDLTGLPPPLQLADSDTLEQGQWAIAIGEPFELQQTVTVGVVSAFNRDEQVAEGGAAYDFKGLLQTSAPINPGNSGGPLIDMDGRVIGVNQLTARPGYSQGIGFAIPSNTVRRVAEELVRNPGVHQGTDRGYVGVLLQRMNASVRNQIGYSGSAAIFVAQVVSGSPAEQAGLQPGDVILQADGRSFSDDTSLRQYIGAKKPGDPIRFAIWSNGKQKLVTVRLIERPAGIPMQ